MKRIVQAIAGYSILTVFFAALLTLEISLIALAVVPVVGIVALVREPIVPKGDVLMTIWTVIMVGLFGLLTLLAGAGAVILPYVCITGWKSAVRQSVDPAAEVP